MKLKNRIKRKLLETKEVKQRVLAETKIIENRFKIIVESGRFKTKKQIDGVFSNLFLEMVQLNKLNFENKLICETADKVFDVLGTVFGTSKGSIVEMFKERVVQFIMDELNMEGNETMGDFLTEALADVEVDEIVPLFTNCYNLSRKISESIPKSYLKKLDMEKDMGGEFMSEVNDALKDIIQDGNFADKIQGRISRIICPIVDRLNEKFDSQLESMKTKLIPNGSDIQS